MLTWILAQPRMIVYAVLLAAALGMVGWFSHARYAAGEAAGRAQVQRQWDRATEAAQAAYAARVRATQARIEADRKAAEEIENDLRTKLADADTAGRDLARRLRDYQARTRRCTVPAAAPAPGQPAGTGGEPAPDAAAGRAAEIDRAVEDVMGACRRDAERLNAWDQWATAVAP